MRNGAQIHRFRRRRVGTGAFEQGELTIAGGAQRVDRLIDFSQCRHARRHDNRFASGGNATQEWQIDIFKGSNLMHRNIHRFQKINSSGVKGGRKEIHA